MTNRIDQSLFRPSCDALNNPLLTPEQINATAANQVGVLFAPGDLTTVQVKGTGPDGQPLGRGASGSAGNLSWRAGAPWMLLSLVLAFLL